MTSSNYVTTAISYPNGQPHIGHAYEAIAADILARFYRLKDEDTFFLTGTDEHGLKMQKTAQDQGREVLEVANENVAEFQRMDDALEVSYDRFIRTTEADHYKTAQELWKKLEEAGDIYKSKYSGWYSIRDEAYYTDDETQVNDEGVRVARDTGTEVEWTEEESYFFALSRYQDQLLELYKNNPGFVQPAGRLNEINNFVESGLSDLSVSRTTFDWGVPVPGDDNHVMYVWVDALANYLTGAGYLDDQSEQFEKFWPPKTQIIGKDITRFHAVYWPAFLMSAGIELPESIFAHGFLTNNGEKMSKSVGNVVSPFELIENFGLDPVRYFLLKEVSFGQDGSYNAEAIINRTNADLANDLGNLAQRSLSMVAKNLEGHSPELKNLTETDQRLLDQSVQLATTVPADYEKLAFNKLLDKSWAVITDTNKYITENEPWILKKTDPERMETVLAVVLEILRQNALLLQPIMPASMGKMLDQLGVDPSARTLSDYKTSVPPKTQLPAPVPIFAKLEKSSLGIDDS